MNQKHIAELYYIAMNNKDIDAVARFLHPEVTLKSPTSDLSGKDTVVSAAKEHLDSFSALKVKEVIGDGDKVVVLCQTQFPFGDMSSASVISCKDGVISSIELFFDTGFFQQPK